MNGQHWEVVTADPVTADVFAQSRRLVLTLRQVQATRTDPHEILYSLPTICGAIPAIAPGTSKLNKPNAIVNSTPYRRSARRRQGVTEHPRYSMVIQWSDEDGVYVVSFPEWEAAGHIAHTHGAPYEEAVLNGQEALALLIESTEHLGAELPAPQTFAATQRAG
jgi:predicted RNase H-like HicB family nuclease